MRLRLQFAAVILVGFVSAWAAHPTAAAQRPEKNQAPPPRAQAPRSDRQPKVERPHAAPQQRPPKREDRPTPRQERRQESRQQAPQRDDRPPNASTVRPGANRDENRPPNATPPSSQHFHDLSQQDQRRVIQNEERFNRLSPREQQDMRDRARVWNRMTPEQRAHVRNDVLPKWKEMPPDRKHAIQQRLRVLQNMPESARNRRLNDPNFTRGMSDEDRATLRDLSHLHVGGSPDPPNE